jgi:hypothetical protein
MRLSWATITRLKILRRSNQVEVCVERTSEVRRPHILTPGVEENIQSSSEVVPLNILSPPPRYYSALKKAHKDRVIPELREEDLEEAFVRGMDFNLLNFTTFLNYVLFAGSGPVCLYTAVLRIISYNTCNRADNQSIKLKIMCNYITNQRDFAYLVRTRVLSRKIGKWLESGFLKRLVQYFIDLSSKAS